MKKSILFLLMFPALLSFSQERTNTLLDGNGMKGAFGSPFLEGSEINGQFSAYIGGGGAVIYDGFFLGGYGIGNSFAETKVNGDPYEIKFKQGGLWLGYAIKDYKMVHTYTSLRIGWGKTKLRPISDDDRLNSFTDRHFALTPEVGVEVNLTDYLRIAFTGGYRLVNGLNGLPGLDNDDFSSFIGGLTFRIGSFNEDWDWNWD